MPTIKLQHYSIVSALGLGKQAQLGALQQQQSGLTPCDYPEATINSYIGKVTGLEYAFAPEALKEYQCRNQQIVQLALETDGFIGAVNQAKSRYGTSRIATLIGTTSSGLEEVEKAYRASHNGLWPQDFNYRRTSYNGATSEFISRYLGLTGLHYTIGNACTSSLSVFNQAARLIRAGIVDAAVVGGVESLCLTTLQGFNSLELLSPEPCRPCDQHRNGLNIGEGAGFILLEKASIATGDIILASSGESSDAHHISTPSADAIGAVYSMQQALKQAKLQTQDIGYINSHGTASLVNDKAEDQAICQLFGNKTPYSSTKGWTGHTLGAAGAIETIFTALALEQQTLWGTLNLQEQDKAIQGNVIKENTQASLNHALVHSIGFGGNNSSLILSRVR
ncbi:beta-ketoacyl-ACP synthase [Piscirickettsia litoralis]|uniref:Beta-ketoacyl-[acyl-carrier-protein] synthase II n=1 Tax=Piscirickettsia litoralis TaxID=1891921 RepID=A0ABX3A1K7_9GAMM|nr:beta-ketoacyl-ACP synthase [Piscirickettsia litoralis]ODN42751.1 beta-ketoacyl-[acyl-carrier-protein] synthase II [Piscirickettsia litoralis]